VTFLECAQRENIVKLKDLARLIAILKYIYILKNYYYITFRLIAIRHTQSIISKRCASLLYMHLEVNICVRIVAYTFDI